MLLNLLILSSQVACPNKCSPGSFMDRSSLPQHLLSCPSVAVICLNCDTTGNVCNAQLRRSQLDEHQASCLMILTECQQGCECVLSVGDMARHSCLTYLRLQNESLKMAHDMSIATLTRHDHAIAAANIKLETANKSIATLTAANQTLRTEQGVFAGLINLIFFIKCSYCTDVSYSPIAAS